MPIDSPDATGNGYTPDMAPEADLQAEYRRLRKELERLLAAPEKDLAKVDLLVDRLEKVQLAFKGQHGIKGNNPNE